MNRYKKGEIVVYKIPEYRKSFIDEIQSYFVHDGKIFYVFKESIDTITEHEIESLKSVLEKNDKEFFKQIEEALFTNGGCNSRLCTKQYCFYVKFKGTASGCNPGSCLKLVKTILKNYNKGDIQNA